MINSQDRNIVFVPPICNWNFLKQLPQQMSEQFAKNGYKVIFCNERIVGEPKMQNPVENVYVFANAEHALSYIRQNDIKIDIIYNSAAKNYKFVDALKPRVTIYHSCDSFDEWKKLENFMISRADIILCTSEFLYNIRNGQHPNAHLVRNGCNEAMINASYYKEEKLKFIQKPICVFSGAIGNWVATYLIRNTAKHFYTTIIGVEFGKTVPDNCMFFKAVEHKRMIDFLNNMDIGLLPFVTKKEVTQAANPIKLWEYLACGLPVIATDWAETNREELKDVVLVAKTDDEYVELIQEYNSFSEDKQLEIKNKCYEVARNNTWESRFKDLQKALDELGGV